ncbi:SNF2 family N-terminal domain-containing protein [Mrakia frigida]|uniref:SNF2 family N-terminal domain-containing protein n=1 Tax=Mrakia frigida TaxID=29902 RepID=UPI003FCC186E
MSRSEADVIAVANKTLGGENALPPGYLDIIREFLETNPYDDNFIIERGSPPTPHFGVLTCMEESCWTDIPLTQGKSADGGASIGVGSLDNYREHINNTPDHLNARNSRQATRIAADKAKGVAIKRPAEQNAEPSGSNNDVKRVKSNGYASGSGSGSRPGSPMQGVQPVASGSGAQAGMSNEQKRALVKAEYDYLKSMLLVSKQSSIKKRLVERMTEVTRSMNKPGDVREPAPRSYELLAHLPELSIKFGTFANPPAGYGHAPVAPGAVIARPAVPVPVAGPSAPTAVQRLIAQQQQYREALEQAQQARLAAAAGGPAVYAALAGQANPFAPGNVMAGVPGAYNMPGAFAVPGQDEDEDDFAARTGYIPYGGQRPQRNGREVEMKEFFEDSLNDFADNASVNDSLQKLGLDDMKDILPGLNITLMPHQIIGVAWLVEQEAKPKYCGGILADAMGLGKTIQALALMVMNQSSEPKKKSNLIVAPLALLSQWRDEIETKSVDVDNPRQPALSVLIYHGAQKPKTKKEIRGYDVVITTYGTLVSEFPKPKKKKKKAPRVNSDGEVESDDAVQPRQIYGPLAQIEWFRIILDEAQNIRNKATRTSQCIAELEADYRWCLTGTPVTNTLDDLYGLFRFLRTPKFEDWTQFRDHISQPAKRNGDIAAKRVQVILKGTLLRRNKESQIDGKPLLNLGPKDILLEKLQFTDDERETYTSVETRARVRFNKFLKAGTVLKNYANVLTMLLRLRQLANHPYLLARAKGEAAVDGDLLLGVEDGAGDQVHEVTKASELARAISLIGQEFVDKVKAKFQERDEAARIAEQEDANAEVSGDRDCPICFEPVTDSLITSCCLQEFCVTCIDDLHAANPEDPEADPNEKSCPTCRGKLTTSTLFKSMAFEEEPEEPNDIIPGSKIEDLDEDEDLPESSMIGAGQGRRNKMAIIDSDDEDVKPKVDVKGKGRAVRSESPEENKYEDREDIHNIHASTKLQRMLDLINLWAEEHPDDKIIIFSQWVKFIDIIQVVLNREDHRFLRYEGSMSRAAREANVKKFMTQEKCRILVISLKCGGVGLNLTRANRIINMDLAWNAATEDQALDRVHRIGQVKPVEVHRLVIDVRPFFSCFFFSAGSRKGLTLRFRLDQDTVEQRILDLQEKKKKMADASLGEGSGQKVGFSSPVSFSFG